MANRITGSASPAIKQTPQTSGPASPNRSSPVVSIKARPSAEKLQQHGDGLYNFLELDAGDVASLVTMLGSTPAGMAAGKETGSAPTAPEHGEVRQALNKMRFYVTSCMFGNRAIKADDFPLLTRFSEMWAQTTPAQREQFQFGGEFDRFAARIQQLADTARPIVTARNSTLRN